MLVDAFRLHIPPLVFNIASPIFFCMPTALGTGGSVVSVAWHPHTSTLAAVFCDDTVRVFSASYSITPLLKHRLQKSVTQIAWM